MTRKSYSELIKIPTWRERLEYLECHRNLCEETFGSKRYLNQVIYGSSEWKEVRLKVISRDLGYDLGIDGKTIIGPLIVHHINPITMEDILYNRWRIFDMDNLITTQTSSHRYIHYGIPVPDETLTLRRQNDTIPWKSRR